MCLGKVTTNWRQAASIILACTKSRRVLMMKRGETAKFMPNTMVFPGGVVDGNDQKHGDSHRIAAVRELFEESGILLTKNGFNSSATDSELLQLKSEVVNEPSKFSKLIDRVCVDRLIEFNSFLTPATNPRRFYTKFYLALIEEEPKVDLCTSEMSEYRWIDPTTCVENAFDGVYTLPPPQVYELTRLGQIAEWNSDIKKFANTKRVFCPQPIKTIGEDLITNVFPGDHMYIDQDMFNQPLRKLPATHMGVSKAQPTHRCTYHTEPVYSRVSIYQHNLSETDAKDFHQFTTHSKFIE